MRWQVSPSAGKEGEGEAVLVDKGTGFWSILIIERNCLCSDARSVVGTGEHVLYICAYSIGGEVSSHKIGVCVSPLLA